MNNFKSIYSDAPALPLAGMTLEEMYFALSIPKKGIMSKSRVEDELSARIISVLTPTDDVYMDREEISTLKSAFFYSVKLFNNNDDWKYYIAIHELTSIIGSQLKKYKSLSNVSAWNEAMMFIKSYIDIKDTPNKFTLCLGMEAETHRINAIKRLQKIGVRCEFEDDNTLKLSNYSKCYNDLSLMMQSVGGVRFANQLLSMTKYDETKGRFIFTHNSHPDPSKVQPTIPIGYLLNLAYRKTSSKGSEEAMMKYWDNIIELATDLCVALYPIDCYFPWNDMFYGSPTEYMKKWAVYDSILTIQQMSQSFCSDMMNYLIERIEADGRCFNRTFSLREYQSLMNEIFSYTKEKEFVRLKRAQLTSVPDKKHLIDLINEISSPCVNPCFEDPLDYDHVNWSDKPTIGLPNGDLLLYPSSIGAYGWYELMMTLLRESDEIELNKIEEESKITGSKKRKYVSIDNFVGYALEDYVKDKLQAKKITTKCGKYNVASTNGECDVVVEGTDSIILMELKKNLTRNARQGYIYQILLDFAGSVLYSQEQAFRTEALLRRKRELDLNDNGNTSHLSYTGQKCEKVTITLNEYGPLHERIIQKNVLDAFCRYKYEINPDEIKAFITDPDKAQETIDNYKRMEKKAKELLTYISELAKYESSGNYDPFFDSSFFSIEQLCYLIDKSSDTNDFLDKFSNLKSISFSTKNFWAEVDYKLNFA